MAGKKNNKPVEKVLSLGGGDGQNRGKAKRGAVRPRFRGRPRTYATANALARAAAGYFDSISQIVPMLDPWTGEPVLDDDGNVREQVQWLKPPTETALALHIGVNPRTWTNYRDDPELGPVVEWAKEICKSFLLEKLVTREKGNVNGLIFVLENNYGMRERMAVEHSGPTLEEFTAGGRAEF